MASWTNYWRIITPASKNQSYQPKNLIDDGYNLNSAGYAAYSSVSWFSNILKGAQARLQRYKQYEAMDRDDVARALDIIAEEISNPDTRTKLPFIIQYQIEDNENLSDSTVTTLRAALRYWSKFHNFDQKIFNIARNMVKYGDCFFKKTSDTSPWQYVDPTRVIGVEMDPEGNKLAYHVRSSTYTTQATRNSSASQEVEIIPVAAMIHFSMSDGDMSDTAPFGKSLLQDIFNVWQKLSMLEDSIIIYRIVRAPERRVFYVDVGNMPQQRVKQYIEQIKNDLRQKRVPNTQNNDQVDSQFNPESIQEDYFFPVTASGRGSRVETLPGGENFDNPELKFFESRMFRGLRIPTSYMVGQDAQGAQYTDGKVGIAYIEELRFANFIQRLQRSIDKVFSREFKVYLSTVGINIDDDAFDLEFPEPQNFALYRQAALDADLINTFNSIEGVKYLSRRFIIKRYLGLTDDEMQMNEAMLKQERNIEEGLEVTDIQQIYDPAIYDNRKPIKVKNPDVKPEEDEDAVGGGMDMGMGSAPMASPADFGGGGGLDLSMTDDSADSADSAPADTSAPEAPPA